MEKKKGKKQNARIQRKKEDCSADQKLNVRIFPSGSARKWKKAYPWGNFGE